MSEDTTPFHLMSSWLAERQLYIHSTGMSCAFCSRVTGSTYLRKLLADVDFRNLILAVIKNICYLRFVVVRKSTIP